MKRHTLKFKNVEVFDEWAIMAAEFEKQKALEKIKRGIDIEQVLEEFSKNMTAKLLHPVIKAIQSAAIMPYNNDQDIQRYKELYLDKSSKVADHIIK